MERANQHLLSFDAAGFWRSSQTAATQSVYCSVTRWRGQLTFEPSHTGPGTQENLGSLGKPDA